MEKMNKKGTSIGLFVVLFMGIIVALALFAPIADTTGDMTNIRTATLVNYTTSATANGTIVLAGREATTSITVVNASNPSDDWTSNFSLVEENSLGRLAILLKTTDAAVAAGQDGELASVTYSYKPEGYNDTSSARSMILLVLIFAAIAIMAFVVPGFKDALESVGN